LWKQDLVFPVHVFDVLLLPIAVADVVAFMAVVVFDVQTGRGALGCIFTWVYISLCSLPRSFPSSIKQLDEVKTQDY